MTTVAHTALPEFKFAKWVITPLIAAVALIYFVIYAHIGLIKAKTFFDQELFEAETGLSKFFAPKEPLDANGTRTSELSEVVNRLSSKYSVNPLVTWAIIESESNFSHNRIRFEQGWKDEYANKKGWEREPWMTDIEYNLLFSSIGYMQVGYGLWRGTCKIKSYDELLNPELNISCGLQIFSNCVTAHSGESNTDALHICLAQYNGSGKKAEEYAERVMRKLEEYMLVDISVLQKKASAIQAKRQVALLNRFVE